MDKYWETYNLPRMNHEETENLNKPIMKETEWIIKERKEVKSLSHVWLCDPMDCSLPGSSVHEIFQARTLDWVAIPFCREFSQPRDWTRVSCTAGIFLTRGDQNKIFPHFLFGSLYALCFSFPTARFKQKECALSSDRGGLNSWFCPSCLVSGDEFHTGRC